MIDEKKSKVLEAAFEAFLRYGFKRVTMADIAKGAGMSRPALYLLFSGKEEIFAAVVRQVGGQALAEIRKGIAGLATPREQLEFAFKVWVVRAFEMMHQAPDAKELVDCSFGFALKATEEGYAEFERLLAAIIEPIAGRGGRLDLTPQQVARVMSLASRGFKAGAADVADLRKLIANLISITLESLGA